MDSEIDTQSDQNCRKHNSENIEVPDHKRGPSHRPAQSNNKRKNGKQGFYHFAIGEDKQQGHADQCNLRGFPDIHLCGVHFISSNNIFAGEPHFHARELGSRFLDETAEEIYRVGYGRGFFVVFVGNDEDKHEFFIL